MREARAIFQLDDKDYILFIEKKFWASQIYLFRKLERGILEPIPIEKISTSTIREELWYWWLLLTLNLRQKMKKESGKSRGGNSRNRTR